MKPARCVAIAGGTHGNEFTGIYLVKKFERNPALIQRNTFQTVTLLGNPEAFAIARRYVETDLNRCFLPNDLHDPTLTRYEEKRAKEIQRQLTGSDPSVEMIIDLHTTTANMGLTLILVNHHPFNLALAAYLSQINPAVQIYSAYQPNKPNAFLNSLCDLGFAIEVGAIAQGTLNANLFQQTESLVLSILDAVEQFNQGTLQTPHSVTIHQHLRTVDYPKSDRGEIIGMIHPNLQNRDYHPLHPGDPIFLLFDGGAIAYSGDTTVYPIFINEAAYYEKGIALCLTQRQQITW